MDKGLVERYWAPAPGPYAKLMADVVSRHPGSIEAFELCKTTSGWSVPGYRMGKGRTHVFLIGREHGHEPAGNCGLAAVMEGLASGALPASGKSFPQASAILERTTLHLFPLMNPDGAERFAKAVPDSFPATFWRYCQEDSDKYQEIHGEPGHLLGLGRPPSFTDAEMATWRTTGKPIGSLYTEDGVELWMDFGHDKTPQTRALKEQMQRFTPSLFVDIHQMEDTTQLFVPDVGEEPMARHRAMGDRLLDALDAAGLPCNRTYGVLSGWDATTTPQWVHSTYGALAYLYEIHNGYLWYDPQRHAPREVTLPVVSKEQILQSVWHGITGMLVEMVEHPAPRGR
jgi:hypothetical protein